LPVLISNKVNIWREVEESNAGLVEPDHLAGSISLLTRWLNLPTSEKLSMRKKAVDCFTRHFEIEAARRSLYSTLESVVHKGSLVHA